MPVNIIPGSMKYKDSNGQYQEITGLKGDKGDPGGISDVQVNGTSVVTNGVANVPIANSNVPGVIYVSSFYGHTTNNGRLTHKPAGTETIKAGTDSADPIVSKNAFEASFYGLAKAAGDSTQSASSNAVGNYTETAKSKIKRMIGVGEWTQVTDYTFSEDINNATFTFDNAFNEVFIYVDAKPATASTSLMVRAINESGNNIVNRYIGSQINTTEKITLVQLNSMPGACIFDYNENNSSSQMRRSLEFNSATDCGIKSIYVSAYGSVLIPVGSIVKIWAI